MKYGGEPEIVKRVEIVDSIDEAVEAETPMDLVELCVVQSLAEKNIDEVRKEEVAEAINYLDAHLPLGLKLKIKTLFKAIAIYCGVSHDLDYEFKDYLTHVNEED